MMASYVGSFRQFLQMLFLVRYLVIEPVWSGVDWYRLYVALYSIASVIERWDVARHPLE